MSTTTIDAYPPFRLATQTGLYPSDPRKRALANAEALTAARAAETEGRMATPDERDTIARFAGWGGMPHLFDDDPDFDDARAALRRVMDGDAWAAANASVLNSHYTDVDLARLVWKTLAGLGLRDHQDGTPIRVMEPGCGSGVFLSTAPTDLTLDWHGVDVDPSAVAVARALHPLADIRCQPFEQVTWPDDHFDLVIGNVPYGQYSVLDPRHNKNGWRIHYHFAYKALRLTRPGGYVAIFNSAYFLNSIATQIRATCDELGDLVAAVRFPEGTFQAAAKTDALEDLLIFRRRPLGELPMVDRAKMDPAIPEGPNWLVSEWRKSSNGDKWRSNAGMVALGAKQAGLPFMQFIGRERVTRGAHRKAEYTVSLHVDKGKSVRDRAVGLFRDHLVAEIVGRGSQLLPYEPPVPSEASFAHADAGADWGAELDERKDGSIHLAAGGGLVRIDAGRPVPYKAPRAGDTAELKALVRLRDAAVAALAAMVRGDAHDAARRALHAAYDDYVAHWGFLNRYREFTKVVTDTETGEVSSETRRTRPPMGGFNRDPDYFTVLALETWDEATRTATKGPIFYENVVGQPQDPKPTTVAEALAVSLNQRAGVDTILMADLLGRPVVDVETELRAGDQAFENPAGGCWEPAVVYLSGDVRSKRDIAMAAAQFDDRYQRNVAALDQVVPDDLGPEEIDLRLGSPILAVQDVMQFAVDHFGPCTVEHIASVATWTVDAGHDARRHVLATAEYGTHRASAFRVLDWALNLKTAQVFDEIDLPGGKTKLVLNREETEAAQQKLDAMGDRFAEWIWEDPDRSARYVDLYNRKVNCWAAPRFDGSHLLLPGLSPAWTPRPHQKDAIWRILTEGGCVLAHSVGLGKTLVMVAAAVEMRRLGIAGKPLICVPNHMLEQIAREARQLYPAARMLVCTAADASKDGRRGFVARCATGNWDLVVMTHSAFGLIPLSREARKRYLTRRLATLRRAKAEAGGTVKKIEEAVKRLETRLKAAIEQAKDEGGMTFEELGVDHICMDEAHLFKNLEHGSAVVAVKGSKRAEDLASKVDWLTDRYGDFSNRGPLPQPGARRRRLVAATGTPVANTIAELWVMNRFVDHPALTAAGFELFDGWFGAFGQTVARLEVTPDGGGFKVKIRPSRFRNVPELMALWLLVADAKSLKTVQGIDVPTVLGGRRRTVVVPPSPGTQRFVAELMVRASALEDGDPQPRPKIVWEKDEKTGKRRKHLGFADDNMLWVVGDGAKASLDLRLVGQNPDPAGGKIAAVAREVHRIYEETKTRGYGTQTPGSLQLVFCDLGVNPSDRCLDCGYPEGQGPDGCAGCAETVDGAGMSVYERVRIECARLGVPYGRVRFMKEADNDQRKASLFAACRDGLVSVLIGSTERMGVGTNVQTRCVALHHIDAPWRPCDIEQREGRIVRQGNLNGQVELLVYVAEGTFDAFKWQTLEAKAGFIEQIASGTVTSRTVEDIGETTMSFAEIKAAASGNPVILEHAKACMEAKQLRLKRAAHQRKLTHMDWRLHDLTGERKRLTEALRHAEADAAAVARWRATAGADAPLAFVAQRPPAGAAGGLLPDAQDRMVAWVNWWRDDRDEAGRDWKQAWPLGAIGPFHLKLRPERKYTPLEQDPAATPYIEIGSADPKLVPISARERKLPGEVMWEERLRRLVGEPAQRAAEVTAALAKVDDELAQVRARLSAPFPLADQLAAAEARVDEFDAQMKAMTTLQIPDPGLYEPNPPDAVDWAALERDVASRETEALEVAMEALDDQVAAQAEADTQTAAEADGWEDPAGGWAETGDGQGLLFGDIPPPARRRRRRRNPTT